MELITESTSKQICLKCIKAEMEKLGPFTEAEMVPNYINLCI